MTACDVRDYVPLGVGSSKRNHDEHRQLCARGHGACRVWVELWRAGGKPDRCPHAGRRLSARVHARMRARAVIDAPKRKSHTLADAHAHAVESRLARDCRGTSLLRRTTAKRRRLRHQPGRHKRSTAQRRVEARRANSSRGARVESNDRACVLVRKARGSTQHRRSGKVRQRRSVKSQNAMVQSVQPTPLEKRMDRPTRRQGCRFEGQRARGRARSFNACTQPSGENGAWWADLSKVARCSSRCNRLKQSEA
eukprot:6189447-Pleurochrysis_carterae.AAC.2